MESAVVARQNWEIAIQTVLHRYSTQLVTATQPNNGDLIKRMAEEVTRRAIQLHSVTEGTMKELEDDENEL
ncbi:hypothetical protein FE783_21930 [Paenibacillus mesophilus]|uniref:hypothetical protein n=1 Tax=Paenibacillus mesophilus TaxID=2582849 RepID=UPI00110E36B9|nr:hypothetical protein [Paenibacillus mesophilus]TMV47649.1 hypothetical protein FE783_21930 [Paenibacillus mesophilus]